MPRLKKLPRFKSDREAENFVADADLTEYDLLGFVPMAEFLKSAEAVRKDKTISLKLPLRLHDDAQAVAKAMNMPTQKFVRLAIAEKLARAVKAA